MNDVVAPPPGLRMLYKLFGKRLPPEYRAWVHRDVMSSTFPREEALRRSWLNSVAYTMLAIANASEGWFALVFAFGVFTLPFFHLWSLSAHPDKARKAMLDRQDGKVPPYFTRQTPLWMAGGLVLAFLIYLGFETF